MTPEILLGDLEARGVRLRVAGGTIEASGPGSLTAEDLAAVREHKAVIVAVLRDRALGVEWSRVGLHQLNRILEIAVPWSDIRLVIAPGCHIARELRTQDPNPGRVWCVCEVLDLLLTGVSPANARNIAEAQIIFGAHIEGIHSIEVKP